MNENQRGGWVFHNIQIKFHRKTPMLTAKLTKGKESIKPTLELPDNYKSLTVWDMMSLLWNEVGRRSEDQTAQFLMFMDMLMKNPNEVAARTFLGGAVHSCQHNGKMGDELAMLVFQKVFPEEELPAVLSSEIFETLSVRQQDK